MMLKTRRLALRIALVLLLAGPAKGALLNYEYGGAQGQLGQGDVVAGWLVEGGGDDLPSVLGTGAPIRS